MKEKMAREAGLPVEGGQRGGRVGGVTCHELQTDITIPFFNRSRYTKRKNSMLSTPNFHTP